jgi:hypothetical protein
MKPEEDSKTDETKEEQQGITLFITCEDVPGFPLNQASGSIGSSGAVKS